MSTEQRLDIGGDHILVLRTPDGASEPAGANVEHLTPGGKPCTGWIAFDVAHNRDFPGPERKWQVESWDPLTLSPSLLCGCGDHGWVRGGRWVSA